MESIKKDIYTNALMFFLALKAEKEELTLILEEEKKKARAIKEADLSAEILETSAKKYVDFKDAYYEENPGKRFEKAVKLMNDFNSSLLGSLSDLTVDEEMLPEKGDLSITNDTSEIVIEAIEDIKPEEAKEDNCSVFEETGNKDEEETVTSVENIDEALEEQDIEAVTSSDESDETDEEPCEPSEEYEDILSSYTPTFYNIGIKRFNTQESKKAVKKFGAKEFKSDIHGEFMGSCAVTMEMIHDYGCMQPWMLKMLPEIDKRTVDLTLKKLTDCGYIKKCTMVESLGTFYTATKRGMMAFQTKATRELLRIDKIDITKKSFDTESKYAAAIKGLYMNTIKRLQDQNGTDRDFRVNPNLALLEPGFFSVLTANDYDDDELEFHLYLSVLTDGPEAFTSAIINTRLRF